MPLHFEHAPRCRPAGKAPGAEGDNRDIEYKGRRGGGHQQVAESEKTAHVLLGDSTALDDEQLSPADVLANRLVGILHGCLVHDTLYDEFTAWGHRQRVAA